jgi:hypothetical protein
LVEQGEGKAMKDIGTSMKKYKDKAKDKSLTFGKANGGETNPYAVVINTNNLMPNFILIKRV